jgi:hypothetical protein
MTVYSHIGFSKTADMQSLTRLTTRCVRINSTQPTPTSRQVKLHSKLHAYHRVLGSTLIWPVMPSLRYPKLENELKPPDLSIGVSGLQAAARHNEAAVLARGCAQMLPAHKRYFARSLP